MSATLRELIREYLDTAKLMQVATVRECRPWVANVWFAADADMNLYFTSRRTRRHSVDIDSSAAVAGAIVGIPLEGLGQKVRGITFEGSASLLSGDRLDHGYEAYLSRWPVFREHAPLEAIRSGQVEVGVYEISPSNIVLFDEVNFPADPRQVYSL